MIYACNRFYKIVTLKITKFLCKSKKIEGKFGYLFWLPLNIKLNKNMSRITPSITATH